MLRALRARWESVPQFAIIDICILSKTKGDSNEPIEVGAVAIDLRDVRDAGDSLCQSWDIDRNGVRVPRPMLFDCRCF